MPADKNMNILVVDDYQTMIQIIKSMLKQMGFNNVDEASGGKAALDKMKVKPYGLIFSDWDMEPMSGVDLVKKVRAGGSKMPFIMITAENTPETEAEARKAGVTEFIGKPFTIEILKEKMSQVFGA